MNKNIEDIRKDYRKSSLDPEQMSENPLVQFQLWFDEALKSDVMEANAMNLATVSKKGTPSSRIVLLKGIEEDGFLFYTNYQSRKGRQIEENEHAALTFFWPELERQVRIEGVTEKVSPETSTAYFQSRPKGSQIGAWASPQSAIIENREILEERAQQLEKQYATVETLPRPQQWGGYRVIPGMIEFWQGRSSRMHDRLTYFRDEKGNWDIQRLAP